MTEKEFEIATEKFNHIINTQVYMNKTPAGLKNIYVVTLLWDYNDADYIPLECNWSKEGFEDDAVLKLVLCFIKDYGGHIEKQHPKIDAYLTDMDMIAYGDDGAAHSVEIDHIIYYDENKDPYHIKLPDFRSLFNEGEDDVKILYDMIDQEVASWK